MALGSFSWTWILTFETRVCYPGWVPGRHCSAYFAYEWCVTMSYPIAQSRFLEGALAKGPAQPLFFANSIFIFRDQSFRWIGAGSPQGA
jgi:hypothetical protein